MHSWNITSPPKVQGVYFSWTLIILSKISHISIGTDTIGIEELKPPPTIQGKLITHDYFKSFI